LLCCFNYVNSSDIFLPPLGGVKTPKLRDDTALQFFYVFNLCFVDDYTPLTFFYTPPHFKFLEITVVNRGCYTVTDLYIECQSLLEHVELVYNIIIIDALCC